MCPTVKIYVGHISHEIIIAMMDSERLVGPEGLEPPTKAL